MQAYAIVPTDNSFMFWDSKPTGIHVDHARRAINQYLSRKRLNVRARSKIGGHWFLGSDLGPYDDDFDLAFARYDMTFSLH